MGELVLDEVVPASVFGVQYSPTISKLAEALSKAQGEMEAAAKDSTNPHFNRTYADLASVWEAVRLPLSKNGLAVCQFPSSEGAVAKVVTMLTHSSGEWTASELKIKAQSDTAQNIGSAITYARRYSLMAVCGIAPDDDDGNAASGRDEKPSNQKPAQKSSQGKKPAGKSQTTQEMEEFFDGPDGEAEGKKVANLMHIQFGCKTKDDYTTLVRHVTSQPEYQWDMVKTNYEVMQSIPGLLDVACKTYECEPKDLLAAVKRELGEKPL